MVAETLAALAKAGVSNPVLSSRAAAQLKRADQEAFDSTSTNHVVMLLMACAKMQVRDNNLFDTFAGALLRRGEGLFLNADVDELVNIIHAFTKVHIVHQEVFGSIGRALTHRADAFSLENVVKYLHAVGKVEYVLPHNLQECIRHALQSHNLKKLGVFELLKLATAAGRLGLVIPALEEHIAIVLPNEAKGRQYISPARRPTPKRLRRKSVRKMKWIW